MKRLAGLVVLLVAAGLVETSLATTIQWASIVSSSNLPPAGPAENALGRPDAVFASFFDGNAATAETATYAGFGGGDNIDYDFASLAALLGISESLLGEVDFISFEGNGTRGLTFETSDWLFDDGTNSLAVSHTLGSPPAGAVVALGNVSVSAYDLFFGTSSGFTGDYAYILFDIDGSSAVNPLAPGFTVFLSATGSTAFNSPEPDVMGRFFSISVPEPGAALVVGTGLLVLLACGRRRKLF